MGRDADAPSNQTPAWRAASCVRDRAAGGVRHKWGSLRTPCVGGELIYGDIQIPFGAIGILDDSVNWVDRLLRVSIRASSDVIFSGIGGNQDNLVIGQVSPLVNAAPPAYMYLDTIWYTGTGSLDGKSQYFIKFIQTSTQAPIAANVTLFVDSATGSLKILNEAIFPFAGVFWIEATPLLNQRVPL